MIKDIVLPLTGTPGDANAVAAALALTAAEDAHLALLELVNLPVPVPGPWGMVPDASMASLYDELRAQSETRAAKWREKLKAAGVGAGFLVTAGVFAFFATLVLTAAGVLALALVLPAWAAALVVGGALLLLAGLAAAIGVGQLKHGVPPVPTETIESVKEDVRVVRGLRKRGAS